MQFKDDGQRKDFTLIENHWINSEYLSSVLKVFKGVFSKDLTLLCTEATYNGTGLQIMKTVFEVRKQILREEEQAKAAFRWHFA
jgi:hypothetical protein